MGKRETICAAGLAALLVLPVRAADAPVDTGLWEMQATMSMGGIQIPAAALEKMRKMGLNPPGQPTTATHQTCVTEQTLARFGEMPGQGRCHKENVQRSSKDLSFDLICQTGNTDAKGRVSMLFDDRTHVHGTVKMSGTHTDGSGRSIPFSVDSTETGHWVSSDCGAVKPAG